MDFTSSVYLAFVTATVLAFNAWREPRFRQWVLLLANLVFLASFVRSFEQLVPLAGFLGLGYAATRWVARWAKRWVLGLSVALIVVVFVVLKRYTFLPAGIDYRIYTFRSAFPTSCSAFYRWSSTAPAARVRRGSMH